MLLVCCLVLVAAGYVFDRQSTPVSTAPVSEREPYVELSMNDRELSLVNVTVEEWMKWEKEATELYEQFRTHGDTYGAKIVRIAWGVFDIPDGSFIRKQHFEIATDADFQNSKSYDLRAGERSIELYDLLVDTQYFFRITVEIENHEGCTLTDSFRTKWSPRIIEVENLQNARDIGGWKTVDGKTVKQGMLYRGGELDGATNSQFQLTADGAESLCDLLQIRTELDLRQKDLEGARDVLGQEVVRHCIPSPAYDGFQSDNGKRNMKALFDTLAEAENYPVYLHCDYGADRTGVACYILEALLGMSREDCYREWELSALANGSGNYEAMDRFVAAFQKLEGETLQNKAENYLLSIGITQEQIDSIRDILVP